MIKEDASDKFRQLAKEATRRAKASSDKELKNHFNDLANGWQRLADMLDADFERFSKRKG